MLYFTCPAHSPGCCRLILSISPISWFLDTLNKIKLNFFDDFRILFDEKTIVGYYINLLPQALTGCNTWISWCLFLSFFIGLCSYVEACVADFQAHIHEICSAHKVEEDGSDEENSSVGESVARRNGTILNETVELHIELTKWVTSLIWIIYS